jgi:hypothetical protein
MRITKPLQELKEMMTLSFLFKNNDLTDQAILIVSKLDSCVEDKNHSMASDQWSLLYNLLSKVTGERYRQFFTEIDDLRDFERWEINYTRNRNYSFDVICKILFLKSADINIYRKIYLLENNISVSDGFYDLTRKIDFLREIFDDIQDMAEDNRKQSFNIVNIAMHCHENWYFLISNLIKKLTCDAQMALKNISILDNINEDFVYNMREHLDAEKDCFSNQLLCCRNIQST